MAAAVEHRRETVLRWAWRYHNLSAHEHDSLRDAALAARYDADTGDAALECIEVVTDGVSRIVPQEEIEAIIRPIQQAEDEAWLARAPHVAAVRLSSPNGAGHAVWDTYATMNEANAEADRLILLLGRSRVQVTPLRVSA